MIVQEDVPYTKEEVKAMVNTIHDLREKVSQLGWHPASDLPPRYKEVIVICRTSFTDGTTHQALGYARYTDNGWDREDIKWWCYPPKEE